MYRLKGDNRTRHVKSTPAIRKAANAKAAIATPSKTLWNRLILSFFSPPTDASSRFSNMVQYGQHNIMVDGMQDIMLLSQYATDYEQTMQQRPQVGCEAGERRKQVSSMYS
jgi:hypothetical protein